jgi:hypothetical protein
MRQTRRINCLPYPEPSNVTRQKFAPHVAVAPHFSGAAYFAANCSASGLKRQVNDLIVIESAGAAAAFKRAFDARFASGETLISSGK